MAYFLRSAFELDDRFSRDGKATVRNIFAGGRIVYCYEFYLQKRTFRTVIEKPKNVESKMNSLNYCYTLRRQPGESSYIMSSPVILMQGRGIQRELVKR